MKRYDLTNARFIFLLVLLMLSFRASGSAQRIYSDPGKSHGNKPYELPFQIPRSRALARAEDRSDPFHAVILKTAARCSIPDQERVSAQAFFPRNKVHP
jgi:hypothetical protein